MFNIVCCNYENADIVKKQLKNILGESVRIQATETQKRIIQKNFADIIVAKEFIENYVILNCYDSKLPRFVLLDGKRVNIQIAISESFVDIGYPLILNGF